MKLGTKEKIYWLKNIYPEQLQAYLDLGWVLDKPNQPTAHPFIDGCTIRWNGEQLGPTLND